MKKDTFWRGSRLSVNEDLTMKKRKVKWKRDEKVGESEREEDERKKGDNDEQKDVDQGTRVEMG